jgi:hypothetical protein
MQYGRVFVAHVVVVLTVVIRFVEHLSEPYPTEKEFREVSALARVDRQRSITGSVPLAGMFCGCFTSLRSRERIKHTALRVLRPACCCG